MIQGVWARLRRQPGYFGGGESDGHNGGECDRGEVDKMGIERKRFEAKLMAIKKGVKVAGEKGKGAYDILTDSGPTWGMLQGTRL